MSAMTALKRDALEEHAMSLDENTNRWEQLAELRSDVRHIQSDVTEIKTEVRAVNQRLDAQRTELSAKIESLDGKIDAQRAELSGKIDAQRIDLSGKIEKVDSLRESLSSAKIWALMLYIALAGSLLLVLARGFKWI